MRTNIEIDASGHASKKATVEEALRLLVRAREQRDILALAGQVTWSGNLQASGEGRNTR